MRIAFFDSGMGGLTVLHRAQQVYPHAEYIYYADSENVPYGTKSEKVITALVSKAVSFLMKKDIDILVIACNTATSVCISELRARYTIPIIGMEPAVKPATLHAQYHDGPPKILVTATKRTLRQKKLNDLIQTLEAEDQVEMMSLQKLVKYAEKQQFSGPKVKKYLKSKFKDIDWQDYNSVVLGCTHFIFYENIIASLIPDHVQIIDGNEGTVCRMVHYTQSLQAQPVKRKLKFYQSDKKSRKKLLRPYLEFLSAQNPVYS